LSPDACNPMQSCNRDVHHSSCCDAQG
jgi:hypothetical protein